MIVTIHQPDFMPWLGFFDRWAKSDLYIILDDVQFLRRGWHHRDRIKTANGPAWLTIPVKKKGKYDQLIKDVEIDNENNWRRKHLAAIESAYKKAANFKHLFPQIETIYGKQHEMMMGLNMDLLMLFGEKLGIDSPVALSSDYNVVGTSSEKLLNLVKKINGSVYLSGTGAKNYLDEKLFSKNGVEVRWQQFEDPLYPQLHGEFEPMLSALDYLMSKKGFASFTTK